MKKIILLINAIVISLLIILELSAQINTFARTYPGSEALQIIEANDGGYFVGGSNNGYLQVMKINSIGFIEWIKDFSPNIISPEFDTDLSDFRRGSPINADVDGGVLAIGTVLQDDDSNIRVIKLNSEGNVVWEYTYGEPDKDEFGFAIERTADGDIIVVARVFDSTTESKTTRIIKTTEGGIILWQREYYFECRLFLNIPEVGYIIADVWDLINISIDGDSLWKATITGFSFKSITSTGENKILALKNNKIIQISAEGVIEWVKSFSLEGRPYYAIETSDSSYVILTTRRKIIAFDSGFNQMWEKEIRGNGYYLTETQDDRFIICGNLWGRFGWQWVLKTDIQGNHHSVTLLNPTDGSTIIAFDQQVIEWKASGVSTLNIDYSLDSGINWNRIASGYPASVTEYKDTISWYISNLVSDNCIIRIEDSNNPSVFDLSDPPLKLIVYDSTEVISTNEIRMWVWNDGTGSFDPRTDANGFYWPGGDTAFKSAIFMDGLVWGGKLNGEIRVNGSTYRSGLNPGRILPDGTPDEYPSLNSKIFKIRKDWQQLPEGFRKDRLEYDYLHWPVEIGAPFEDINRDGVYTPGFDKVKFIGDETLWYVCNDLDTATSRFTFGSDPIGLEIQTTVFGFEREDLKDVVFKKYKVINKSNTTIEDMYFTYWADDDLGDAGDDYEGFDTTYNLSYMFNGDNDDGGGSGGSYGTPPPAVGHMLAQGPIVEGEISDSARYGDGWKRGYKNLGMTSTGILYKNPWQNLPWNPPQGVYDGTLRFYDYMRGLNWDGSQIINPITGELTIWGLAGDPVTGTGWYEGSTEWSNAPPSGDRRYHLPSGPFTMAPGDTQEVTIAILIARGTDNINSITELRNLAAHVQEFYDTELVEMLKETETVVPEGYALYQNYPNPFNNTTTIEYEVPFNSKVEIKLYDILGREVKTLVNNEEKIRWRYKLEFNATGLASGVYFYRMRAVPTGRQAGDFINTKKMVLLK